MTKSPKNALYRIAQGNTPWVAYKLTKFEGRFDDPEKRYFVLYGCSARLGCFVECLAYYRKGRMDGWDEMPGFEDDHPLAAGVVPDDWCLKRSIQSALADGTYADVAHSGWIAELLERIPWYLCRGLQYPWIDQSTIYQAKSRAITQWISRVIYEDRRENFSGIYYTSKHGSDFDNWAIFEDKARLENLSKVSEILENDKDLLAACSLLHIKPPTLTLVSKTTA